MENLNQEGKIKKIKINFSDSKYAITVEEKIYRKSLGKKR